MLFVIGELATARGSFLVDSWLVWNNATISENSRVETKGVPVRIDLKSHQVLWIGLNSRVWLKNHVVEVEKGAAKLDFKGPNTLLGRYVSGLQAGSDLTELSRAATIPELYQLVREQRPMSQRP